MHPVEIVVITGKTNLGKTTLLERLVEHEKSAGRLSTGIIARGAFNGKNKIGFDAMDISTGKTVPLARSGNKIKNGFPAGRFYFSVKNRVIFSDLNLG
ncbi:MAG: hypothetical protein COZ15_01625 [Elusimicrobia bacterium CG_4_10_14_3_um_filter_49_12_50_7]|nr:MAG: hypothetical protein COS41_06025 [Elusimicrobia bacterium CG03_land_8_20_14_0_80_50_18]PIX16234.1 MAG: hypothetical protein COZ72_01490 [Elusimicrobia bacterium CG_4_8_14_3_um_filter_50_9]PIY17886.1 MAG: hypothetical protein COZ15_01625 [Elusimicrobia bacterium CG_4_10_14_3_um_filter_49_12_50_7]